jgi:hypothetical protein
MAACIDTRDYHNANVDGKQGSDENNSFLPSRKLRFLPLKGDEQTPVACQRTA